MEGTRSGAEGGCGCRAWGEDEWQCKMQEVKHREQPAPAPRKWSLRGGCVRSLPLRIVKGALVTQELSFAKLQRSSRPVSSREATITVTVTVTVTITSTEISIAAA